jgi:hypothetical protein
MERTMSDAAVKIADEPLSYTLDEAAAKMGSGYTARILRKRIAQGRLKAKKEGTCYVVLKEEIDRYLGRGAAASAV